MVKKGLTALTLVTIVLVSGSCANAQAQTTSSEAYASETMIAQYTEQLPPIGFTPTGHRLAPTYNAPDHNGKAIRWSMIVSSSLLDATTTSRALGLEGTREANPILAPLTKNKIAFMATKVGLSVLTARTLDGTAKNHPKRALVIAIAVAAYQSGLAWRNHQVYVKNQAR